MRFAFFLLVFVSIASAGPTSAPSDESAATESVASEPAENSRPVWKKILRGVGAGLKGMSRANSGQRDDVDCTSRRIGNTVYTNCR